MKYKHIIFRIFDMKYITTRTTYLPSCTGLDWECKLFFTNTKQTHLHALSYPYIVRVYTGHTQSSVGWAVLIVCPPHLPRLASPRIARAPLGTHTPYSYGDTLLTCLQAVLSFPLLSGWSPKP